MKPSAYSREPAPEPMPDAARVKFVCLGLALLTLAIFARTAGFDFLNYDDPLFVLDHELVRGGLTAHGIVEAFSTAPVDYWRPLSWMSHMLDIELFGLQAGGHHAVNTLWHTAAAVMVFLSLRRLTGDLWPAAAVAAFFAIHPLHVESVAWVAERKDVMCGFFWFLTLWAYAVWVREPTRRHLVWLLGSYVLGALSKPMIVTLPCVLLLLDVWPLRRVALPSGLHRDASGKPGPAWKAFAASVPPLLREKIPLFILSAILSLIAFRNVAAMGLEQLDKQMALPSRWATALVSFTRYVVKSIWPADLSVYYPLPPEWPAATVAWSGAMLVAATLLAAWQWRARPWIAVGWLWFLGTLVPVIGIVRISQHAMADRYSYVPQVGLFIAVAWTLKAWAGHGDVRRRVLAWGTAAALGACAVVTWRQLDHWRDSLTLFNHALRVTDKNVLAHYCYGRALHDAGRAGESIPHYRIAIEWNAPTWEIHNRLGAACAELGRLDEAITHFEESARLRETPDAPLNLGRALALRGRHGEARARWRDALANPVDAARAARFAESVIEEARRNAHDPEWLCNMGVMFNLQGRRDEAAAAFRETLKKSPGHADATRELERLSTQQLPRRDGAAPRPRPPL